MKQIVIRAFSWLDIFTVYGIAAFLYIEYPTRHFLTSGKNDDVTIILFVTILFGIGFGLKHLKRTRKHFRAHFILEIIFLAITVSICLIAPPRFYQNIHLYNRRNEIRNELASGMEQSRTMFAEYEKYASIRGYIYRSKLAAVVSGKEINPEEYRSFGFEGSRVSDSEQIRNKVFSLNAKLLSPDYFEMKKTNLDRLAKSKDKIINGFFYYKAIDIVNEMESMSTTTLNGLIHLSMHREKNETAASFTYDLSFDKDIKKGELTQKERLLTFAWVFFFQFFILIPYFFSERHVSAPYPLWRCLYGRERKDYDPLPVIDTDNMTDENDSAEETAYREEEADPGQEQFFTRDGYIKNVRELSVPELAQAVHNGIVSLNDLGKNGMLGAAKRKEIQKEIDKIQKEEEDGREDRDAFRKAEVSDDYCPYMEQFPEGIFFKEAKKRESQKINKYLIDEYENKFTQETLIKTSNNSAVNYEIINALNQRNCELQTNSLLPEKKEQIPSGYTDVFLWGCPSSGKTTSLSVIMYMLKNNYTMGYDEKGYGAVYRNSLINIFNNEGYGRLPEATVTETTEYMPVLIKRRNSNENYRKISFVDLSGELFEYFYEFFKHPDEMDTRLQTHFDKVGMYLNSNNSKIHLFFLDHTQLDAPDHSNRTQNDYFDAAIHYFKKHTQIIKKNTLSIRIIITKCDEIKGNREEVANRIIYRDFGGFYDDLKTICDKNAIPLDFKLFSIGDVVFKRYCKINGYYANDIIEFLLNHVRPGSKRIHY